VFAGIVRAPITSVLIIIEMTAGYGLTLPLMISNMMAYGLARQLRPTPIYEALLEQDGVNIHPPRTPVDRIEGLTIDMIQRDGDAHASFAPGDGATRMLAVVEEAGRQEVFPVLDGNRKLVGIITLEDLTCLAGEPDLEGVVCATDLMRRPVALRERELVSRALELMMSSGVRELPVVDGDQRVLGMIDEADVAHEYMRARAAKT